MAKPLTLSSKLITDLLFVVILTILSALPYKSNGQIFEFYQKDTTDQNHHYPRYSFLELKIHYGAHLPTGVDELQNTVESNPFTATEIRLGWKGYGRRMWHQLYSYPTYGVGLYQATFVPQESILGNPSAIYGFFNAPIKRWKNSAINYDVGAGLSYNFIGYDPESNPSQRAIGSEFNVYFNVQFEYEFLLSKRMDMAVGFDFTHFSNGRSRTPNKGVNLVSLSTGIKYNQYPYIKKQGRQKGAPLRPDFIDQKLPEFHGFWEFYLFVNGGIATSSDNIQNRELYYGAGSIGVDVGRHLGYISKIVLGFDYFYDGSLQEEYAEDYGGIDNVPTSLLSYPGVHIGHELMFYRFALITHYGHTFKKIKGRGNWYLRVGLKYDLGKHFFTRVTLKTPGGFEADFIEWGVGFTFYSKKRYLN